MNFEAEIEIDAPSATVWAILADVERWPEWTASVKKVEILSGAPAGVSTKVRVKQPRLRALVWDITDFVPGREFTWHASTLGVRCAGIHRVETGSDRPGSDNTTKVVLRMEQVGVLAPLVGLLTARLTRRYLSYEAEGLKARAEEWAARSSKARQ